MKIKDKELRVLLNRTDGQWLRKNVATMDEASILANSAHNRLRLLARELAAENLALRKVAKAARSFVCEWPMEQVNEYDALVKALDAARGGK